MSETRTPAIGAWMRERFPARNAVFFVVFHVTGLLVARASAGDGRARLAWTDLAGFAALWSFFLLLRVADEHKDWAADAVAHPGRVLQRGLVTLRDLRALGAIALVVQAGASLGLDRGVGPVTAWWLAALCWSALMAREFFAREWLRARILLYAVSHMVVMPLVAFWVASMAAPDAPSSPAVRAFAALAFLAGLAFEIARKLRAPSDEHPMADSYTQALGIPLATALLMAVVAAAAIAALVLTSLVAGGPGVAATATLGGAILLAGWALSGFRRRPTPASAKRGEAAVGVATLATHLVPAAALLLRGAA